MKIKLLALVLLTLGLVWMAMPRASYAQEGIVVTATAYTCDANPRNPMHPCGPLRWGGNVRSAGMACPFAWKNRYYEVPGYGVRRCDDTGAYDTYYGRPHIDIRVATWAEASRFGVRRMVIYPASAGSNANTNTNTNTNTGSGSASTGTGGAPAAPAATSAPIPAADTSDGALYRAMALEPLGDRDTAHATWLRLRTAREYFPALTDKVAGDGDRAVWAVLLWVPPTAYPQWTQAVPSAAQGVAGRWLLLDAGTGELVTSAYVSPDVTAIMGWLPDDPR